MKHIALLPANQRVDALLNYFVGVLNAMDSGTIRRLRDQIMARFAMCGCSFDTCQLMIDFINGHLALRESAIHREAAGEV
jgi:hypothetical protein